MLGDAWLSGFADGEASFLIVRTTSHGEYDGFSPWFQVTLRADDIDTLLAIRDEFGGSLSLRDRKGGNNRNPSAQLTITAKEGLAKLASYFDRFPLRSKKARDFELWREAVRLYIVDGRHAEDLPELRDAIRATRVYQEPGP